MLARVHEVFSNYRDRKHLNNALGYPILFRLLQELVSPEYISPEYISHILSSQGRQRPNGGGGIVPTATTVSPRKRKADDTKLV